MRASFLACCAPWREDLEAVGDRENMEKANTRKLIFLGIGFHSAQKDDSVVVLSGFLDTVLWADIRSEPSLFAAHSHPPTLSQLWLRLLSDSPPE